MGAGFVVLAGQVVLGGVNAWRPGGTAWFTLLHQAAWRGASEDTVTQLLRRGAWRTLPDAQGRTPAQVARERGHRDVAKLLEPSPVRTVAPDVLAVLDRHLRGLIESRVRPQLTVTVRHPLTAVLTELPPGSHLWFAVPGMYGGFDIELRNSYLFVSSWSRVVGGSGQAHVITTEGPVLVEDGFV